MFQENILCEEAKNELNIIKKLEKMADRENLVYRTNECPYCLKNFRTFGKDIYNGITTLKEANEV